MLKYRYDACGRGIDVGTIRLRFVVAVERMTAIYVYNVELVVD